MGEKGVARVSTWDGTRGDGEEVVGAWRRKRVRNIPGGWPSQKPANLIPIPNYLQHQYRATDCLADSLSQVSPNSFAQGIGVVLVGVATGELEDALTDEHLEAVA